jgi:G3E family GTPase
MRRIPVVILSGFLGSGKTTLLLKMLTNVSNRGLDYAVLINERGKTDIDGLLVSKKFDDKKIESILDGCICCSKKSEIAQSIDILLQKRPNIIFIELTGVANAEEVAFTLNQREIIAKVVLKNVITIIDAEYILDSHSRDYQEIMYQQLECANHIVVNKIDLIKQSQRREIEKIIEKRNATAPMEFALHAEINFDKFLTSILSTEKSKQTTPTIPNEHRHQKDMFSNMTTIGLPIDGPLFRADINNFFMRHSDVIVRAKGFVPLIEKDGEVSYLLQYSGVKRMDWKPESSEQYYLILIGVDLDSTSLREEWINIMESRNKLV